MKAASRVALLCAGILWAGAWAVAAEPPSVTIVMQKQTFVPAVMTITAGTRIIWINKDDMPHSVTAGDKRFDSGPVMAGKSFQWTAQGSGTIDYHCIFHPSMTAVLNVADANGERRKQPVDRPPHAATVEQQP